MEERELLRILETAFIRLKNDVNYRETKRRYQQALEEIVALIKKPKVMEEFMEKWADKFDSYAQNGQIVDIDLIKQMLKEAGVSVA